MEDYFVLLKIFFFVFLLTQKTCYSNSCKSAKCGLNSFEIRYPFQIQGLQPNQCGLPDFKLFCEQNRTMIKFPSYGDLVVKSIFYDTKRLNLLDPKNCVHEVFLNLNLSLTPFSYYYVLKQYKYINCSSELVNPLVQVPCLSGSTYHVYIVESSFSVPISCNFVKTVDIPFSYSPYLSDNSFGLGLKWNSTEDINVQKEKEEEEEEEATTSGCDHGLLCEMGRVLKYFHVTGIIIAILVKIVMIIVYHVAIPRCRKGLNGKKEKDRYDAAEVAKLLKEEYKDNSIHVKN